MIRFSRRRDGRSRELMFAAPSSPPRGRRQADLGDHHDEDEDDEDELEPIPDPVTLTVREVQRALVRAGYDIGPTGTDNRWGPMTLGAFQRFLDGQTWPSGTVSRVEVSAGSSIVLMEQFIWNRLTGLPRNHGGERQSRRTPRDSTTTTTREPAGDASGDTASDVDLGEEESEWWQSPWLWGAVALAAGAGIVFVATRDTEDDLQDEELLPAF